MTITDPNALAAQPRELVVYARERYEDALAAWSFGNYVRAVGAIPSWAWGGTSPGQARGAGTGPH